MSAKPLIYIETSVVSYLTAKPSRDVISMARQQLTLAWWKTQLPNYTAVISAEVLREATRGDSEASRRRLEVLQEIFILPETPEVSPLETALLAGGAIPLKAKEDARHVAICAVNRVPFLATWNFKHISNPLMWDCMRRICKQHGHPFPTILRPD
jgi:hypothetical protein